MAVSNKYTFAYMVRTKSFYRAWITSTPWPISSVSGGSQKLCDCKWLQL